VLYAIVGVGIPLGWTWCCQRIKSRQQHTSA
jgi:hypothetical protein